MIVKIYDSIELFYRRYLDFAGPWSLHDLPIKRGGKGG